MESQQPLVSNGGGLSWLLAIPMLANQGRSALLGSSNEHLGSAWAIIVALAIASIISAIVVCWLSPGGSAWGRALIKGNIKHRNTIPGPRGLPILGSLMSMGGLAHRRLAKMAASHNAMSLMSLSLGNTRVVIASRPDTARELLNSSSFADRPLKQSAQQLLFGRAIGFAPQGDYWRNLRRIAATHLFAPKRIAAHGPARQFESDQMVEAIRNDTIVEGSVRIRGHLQRASLNNIMSAVFGRRYNFDDSDNSSSIEAQQLKDMVREGFELLGAFNWADHLPALQCVDPQNIHQRCAKLVPRVSKFVQNIINEHRVRAEVSGNVGDKSDFVDVLLGLQGEDKLADEDMIAVLWVSTQDSFLFLTLVKRIALPFRFLISRNDFGVLDCMHECRVQSRGASEMESFLGYSDSLNSFHLRRKEYMYRLLKTVTRLLKTPVKIQATPINKNSKRHPPRGDHYRNLKFLSSV